MRRTVSRGRPVAAGIQRAEGDRFYNSLRVLTGEGQETARYDKAHLVPFGEYIPFGDLAYDWFGITAFAAQAGATYSAGSGPDVIDLGPLGKVLPLICYEAVFPGEVTSRGPRAGFFLNVTNDGWFGQTSGPYQHFAQARLRAIEEGVPVVRATPTGITGIIDTLRKLMHDERERSAVAANKRPIGFVHPEDKKPKATKPRATRT